MGLHDLGSTAANIIHEPADPFKPFSQVDLNGGPFFPSHFHQGIETERQRLVKALFHFFFVIRVRFNVHNVVHLKEGFQPQLLIES